jgi:serine/threonine-protein kinase
VNSERVVAALADRYRIESRLGEGGMATVYLAFDLKHDRRVALKVLKPELAAVLGAERFIHEIKTTANLQHPHILPLFDSGRTDGTTGKREVARSVRPESCSAATTSGSVSADGIGT